MIDGTSLERMQDTVARSLTDTCTVTRAIGRPAFNKETSTTHTAPPETIYSGACRVAPAAGPRRSEVGGEMATQREYVGRVPNDAPEIRVDDRLTLTVSADESLVGRGLRVADVIHGGTVPTGRRLALVDDVE